MRPEASAKRIRNAIFGGSSFGEMYVQKTAASMGLWLSSLHPSVPFPSNSMADNNRSRPQAPAASLRCAQVYGTAANHAPTVKILRFRSVEPPESQHMTRHRRSAGTSSRSQPRCRRLYELSEDRIFQHGDSGTRAARAPPASHQTNRLPPLQMTQLGRGLGAGCRVARESGKPATTSGRASSRRTVGSAGGSGTRRLLSRARAKSMK
jgi:hypothetical protein